jgi:hypothetical protein
VGGFKRPLQKGDQTGTDPSDMENGGFSDIIGFNSQKDMLGFELNDLEMFINKQYKSKKDFASQSNQSSGDSLRDNESQWDYDDEEPTPTFVAQKHQKKP